MSGQEPSARPQSGAAVTRQMLVTMTADTVAKLYGEHAALLGFKAVRASQGGGAPLVWFARHDLAATMRVDWTSTYQAFTSFDPIVSRRPVRPGFSADIDLGQVLLVNDSGTGQVEVGPEPAAVSVRNISGREFTCGISQRVGEAEAPVCAFPLHGNSIDLVATVDKALLVFTSQRLEQGQVVTKLLNESILVDLSTGDQRSVSYDIDRGWAWDGAWARRYPPNTDLLPVLIEQNLLRRPAPPSSG